MDAPYPPPFPPSPPITAQVVAERRPATRTPTVVKVLFALLLLGFLFSVFVNLVLLAVAAAGASDEESRVREVHFSHQRFATDKVAILTIEGTILDDEGFIRRQIQHARREARDGNLKALVVRINSPGGTISGSDDIYHQLRQLREETEIPIVVSMGGIAASGGYYVAMAVGDTPQSIFAEPTTFTGSIGVIIPHYDLSQLLHSWGVQEDAITSGELKGMGSLARPMTEAERKIFQALVDEGFTRFKDVICSGRPKFEKDRAALDALATGQIYTAEQAKASGLVDSIGYLDDAVARAMALANLQPATTSVVRYRPETGLFSALMGAQARQPGFELSALLELSSPRAYYLCTRLPALIQTE